MGDRKKKRTVPKRYSVDKSGLQTFTPLSMRKNHKLWLRCSTSPSTFIATPPLQLFPTSPAVGQMYELNRRGSMSMVELEQLDAITFGCMLIGSGKGEVTTFGVLYRNGNVLDLVYNGEQFPEYSYRDDEVAMVALEFGDYGAGMESTALCLHSVGQKDESLDKSKIAKTNVNVWRWNDDSASQNKHAAVY